MIRRSLLPLLLLAILTWAPTTASTAPAPGVQPVGQWFGTYRTVDHPWFTESFGMIVDQDSSGYYAVVHVPGYGLWYQPMPAAVDGDVITIGSFGAPWYVAFQGKITGDSIAGMAWYWGTPLASWQATRYTGASTSPGQAPGPDVDLPPLYCTGDATDCGELVPFDPDEGPGYLDYPLNGETWDDQFRSFLRRDLRLLVAHATAKVAGKTANWDYGNGEPLGLGDMSEEDGSIPGTSVGYPGHPVGSHTDGHDIDLAYYQLYSADNLLRSIGLHHYVQDWQIVEAYHCLQAPHMLDPWRTALLIAYLSEHPRIRVIGVDGQAGPILDDALDKLVQMGWIDGGLRQRIPLVYEVTNMGWGFYYFHHHHMHVSLSTILPIASEVDLDPETLNPNSKGKWITGYVELIEGYDVKDIDLDSVALIVDGHTRLPADSKSSIGDRDKDGVPDLMVKFDRSVVAATLEAGTAEMAITGAVNGEFFQGSDTVRVLDK